MILTKARWKSYVENNIRRMGIVNWRIGMDEGEQQWRCLSFLDSAATQKEKEDILTIDSSHFPTQNEMVSLCNETDSLK
jgi:hypothetical protein